MANFLLKKSLKMFLVEKSILFTTKTCPPGWDFILLSVNPTPRKKVKNSYCVILTIFAVDFDRVGGKLKRRSTFARLWKPEVLHLTVRT